MARARSGVSTPRMMDTFAAAFSKRSPPSRTRVTPKPLPRPSRVHASVENWAPSPPSSASMSLHTLACISITNLSKSSNSTPLQSTPW